MSFSYSRGSDVNFHIVIPQYPQSTGPKISRNMQIPGMFKPLYKRHRKVGAPPPLPWIWRVEYPRSFLLFEVSFVLKSRGSRKDGKARKEQAGMVLVRLHHPVCWAKGYISIHLNTLIVSPTSSLQGLCVCLVARVWLFTSPWTVAHQAPLSQGFFGRNTRVGCHFLIQGIFPTQGSNWHLLNILTTLI